VNQWLNPLKCGTGSNLTDVGRAAVRADLKLRGRRLLRRSLHVRGEATVKVCGVAVARLQGQSWSPSPSTGTWWTWEPSESALTPAGQAGGGQVHRRL